MSTRGGGSLEVDGTVRRVSCVAPETISPSAMVHPLATMPLSFLARWRGDATLHGGAFLHNHRAWVVTGDGEAGKSSTLAALAARGIPILADDLVVISDGQVWAGPRCVDLRPDVAARTPAARALGVVAGRERFRLATPAGPPQAPLGGIVLLEWTDGAGGASAMDVGERLRVLHAQHYAVRLGPPEPASVLELLGVPMWRFRRTRDWTRAVEHLDQLLELVAGA